MAVVTYHKSYTAITNDGIPMVFVTQLYKVGVYGILNNNAAAQGNYTPKGILAMEKR